MVVSR